MTRKVIIKKLCRLAVIMLALAFVIGPSYAIEVNLVAVPMTWQPPPAPPDPSAPAEVPMWGFIANPEAVPQDYTCPGAPVAGWELGPTLETVAGDDVTITIKNCLPDPVSVVMTGQKMPTDVGGALLPPVTHTLPGDDRARMKSMTSETAENGGFRTYVFQDVRAGSFIYHSGSDLGKQVHMGLYGMAKFSVNDVGGLAYPDVFQDHEVDLFFSEIDPALHDPDPGDPFPGFANSNNYKPKYFLVNGEVFDGSTIPAGTVGQNVLIRMYSTAFDDIVPTILGMDWEIIAQDGNLYPYSKTGHTVLLSPMKTKDILFNPRSETVYSVFDRKLNLTKYMPDNGEFYSESNGGFYARLFVGAATALTAVNDTYTAGQGILLQVLEADGVLANDVSGGGGVLTAELVTAMPAEEGSVVLNENGSFTFYSGSYSGQTSFAYKTLEDGATESNTAVVTINVNPVELPVAVDDAYFVAQGQTLTVNDPGVLGNDTPSGLTAALETGPADPSSDLTFNADGSFEFTTGLTSGQTEVFTYTVANAHGSDIGTVTITIDPPVAPIAVNDFAQVSQRKPGIPWTPLDIKALENDICYISPCALVLPTGYGGILSTRGGTVINLGSSFWYYPNFYFLGTDSFFYMVRDNSGNFSNIARIIINVVRQ